jgi:hypothetical protein
LNVQAPLAVKALIQRVGGVDVAEETLRVIKKLG